MSERVIFHVDMDAFFVSVEELFDPELKGKPVVVGGRSHERGVVSAASYKAREFGVHSAMPLRQAYERCPQAVFIPGKPERYRDYSQRVRKILRTFTPKLEMASIDEAYLDLSGTRRLMGAPLRVAHDLHEAVREQTGLPCSVGIAPTRLVAKISSGLAKPNGILQVLPGSEPEFLAPLPVKRVPGIGRVAQKNLGRLGIRLIGQLAELDPRLVREQFGGLGLDLREKAKGADAGAWFRTGIGDDAGPKSISHETTFSEDTRDKVVIDATLAKLTQLVCRRLRDHKLYTRTVQLKLRYRGFETLTRARTLPEATDLDVVVLDAIRELFEGNWDATQAVRLLGVHAGNLQTQAGQLNLVEQGKRQRLGRAMAAVDAARDKYGESAVGLGSAMKHARRERVHENPAGLMGRSAEDDE